AQEGSVQHLRSPEIGKESALSAQQARVLDPLDASAEQAGRDRLRHVAEAPSRWMPAPRLPGHPRAAARELRPAASGYCSATSGRGGVPPLDGRPDPGAALARVEVGLGLDPRG